MISEEMLDIFAEFDGDIDGYARCATAVQRGILNDHTWHRISELLQAWTIATSGLAAPAFKKGVEIRLLAETRAPHVAERIKQLASRRGSERGPVNTEC